MARCVVYFTLSLDTLSQWAGDFSDEGDTVSPATGTTRRTVYTLVPGDFDAYFRTVGAGGSGVVRVVWFAISPFVGRFIGQLFLRYMVSVGLSMVVCVLVLARTRGVFGQVVYGVRGDLFVCFR